MSKASFSDNLETHELYAGPEFIEFTLGEGDRKVSINRNHITSVEVPYNHQSMKIPKATVYTLSKNIYYVDGTYDDIMKLIRGEQEEDDV